MKCNVCGGEANFAFSHLILNKYTVGYYHCQACGFLQTEQPYWLEEAYSSAITDADTGLVQRNLDLSRRVSLLLYFLLGKDGKFLDEAGGYGMFTRLMRDIGFDFYWSDKYCDNLLAKGFSYSDASPPYSAVTAFEVLEHLHDPLEFITQLRSVTGANSFIFSTELYDGSPPVPGDWWYYAFATGQHISFYQRRTLDVIAEKIGLTCYSNGSVHLFTDRAVSPVAYAALMSPRISRILSWIPRRSLTSRTMADHDKMMGKTR